MLCLKCRHENIDLNFVWCGFGYKGFILCDNCMKIINDNLLYKLKKYLKYEYYTSCEFCGDSYASCVNCKMCDDPHFFCKKCIDRYTVESQRINNYTMTKPAIKNK